ncbi:MAG TPA: tetratricopeptide repeat-containing glycosyltransferase family protein, partial [Candidatus Paceibacterota bacterium]|nr:tetratricopeptide repeat-containing glycosyltransferase family protein [Candidatus Paceibacterota bacterium]
MSCDCPIQETPADYQQAERLYREGQWRSAEALCRGLLTQDAGHADALNLLGLLARKARKEHEAAGYFARAITRNPSRAAFYSNLGLSFVQTNDLDRAEESFRLALRLEPGNPDFQSNLGLVRFQSGEYGSAASIYRGVLAHQPDHACAHWNLSLVLLLLEDYEQGWKEYEWRLLLENYHGDLARMTRPLWRGEAFQGRSLFVWCEQGHGDTLQFVRYLPLVKGLGGRVILSCQPPLFRLMQTLRGVDQLVANSDPVPEHDLQVPLLSLPRIFGTDAHHIPSQVPYLDATSGIQARILAEGRHLKVGLVWAGDPQHPNDHNRSLRLGQFEPLLELPGATFYSLQVGARAQELENLPAPKRPMDLSPQLQDFADTANVLIQLDLLITADTAVAHLAGALGKPAWVLLPRVPDWRWLLN